MFKTIIVIVILIILFIIIALLSFISFDFHGLSKFCFYQKTNFFLF
jgi:hypothetical protein